MSSVQIASVDYLDFVSGNPETKQAFIRDIGDSFAEIGFAMVSNHGVSEDLRNKLFEAARKFFELPDEVKKKYEHAELAGQRGYIGKNKETAKGRTTPDMKEFFHVGQEIEDYEKYGYPANIWPEEVSELREHGIAVFRKFEETGRHLLQAIALYLNLDEHYFDDKIHCGNSILRLLHYYPVADVSAIPKDAERAAAHEDINLITLLLGGSAAGLQARTRDGEWIEVTPTPDQIVINMGDMLQRLTNGKLVSTTHRVINTDAELMKTSRYSTPFFLHPISEMDLTSLPSTIDEDHPKRFSDMTAGEYLDERIRELGLKK